MVCFYVFVVKPIFTLESQLDYDNLNKEMDNLVNRAVETLRKEGIDDRDMVIQRLADVKYWSQSTHFTVDVPEGRIKDLKVITENFVTAMQTKFGYTLPPGYVETEVVNLRTIAMGIVPKPEMREITRGGKIKDAMKKPRKVWFRDAGFVDTDIYERNLIPVGATFEGPAFVEQPDTTTFIPPRSHCKIDSYGNILIHVER